jgi:DNA polymerase-3 subunit gamma/tau
LKILEEAPKNVFTILCSTEPSKILLTVKNRCEHFRLDYVKPDVMVKLLGDVLSEIDNEPGSSVLSGISDLLFEKIVEKANGSPRAALVLLQQILQSSINNSTTLDDIFSIIGNEDKNEVQIFDLCKAIISRKNWSDIVDIYSSINAHPEAIRLTVLGYFRSCLLKAKIYDLAKQYASVMECFIDPLYEVKPENKLVLSLFKAREILVGKK